MTWSRLRRTRRQSNAIRDADAAFGWVPPAALRVAERLRWVQNPDAGPFYGYYYDELIQHPLTITNPRGIYFDHISHHILMFMFALSRGLPWFVDAQRRRGSGTRTPARLRTSFLATRRCSSTASAASGTRRRGCATSWAWRSSESSRGPSTTCRTSSSTRRTSLDEVLPRADFVVTTVPHTPETEFMFNAERFRRMKSSAYFINIGRGMVCKIDDLADAVESGEIAGAGLDVFEQEPLPSDHKLWGLPNVLITPHVAVADAENIPERRFQVILDNARRFLNDEPLTNVVDKERWY